MDNRKHYPYHKQDELSLLEILGVLAALVAIYFCAMVAACAF